MHSTRARIPALEPNEATRRGRLPTIEGITPPGNVQAAIRRVRYNGGVTTDVVLVTGGSRVHRLARRRPAARSGPSAADLRPAAARRYHAGRGRRASAISAISTRCARRWRGCDAVIHLAAAADVNEVLGRSRRGRAAQRARHAARARGRAPRRASARVVYASTIWAYSDTPAELPRGVAAAAAARAPLHGDQARRRAVLPLATASSTASSTRSCASASRTARARGRRRSSRRSSRGRSRASR